MDTNKPKCIITAQSEDLLNGTKLFKACKNYSAVINAEERKKH